jgi:hypothetical protein
MRRMPGRLFLYSCLLRTSGKFHCRSLEGKLLDHRVVHHPDLADKGVLITGGATGIGAAL